MPNRILRDGILSSEGVCSLSWAEEVFYRRLMSVVDDHGRFHALPKLLRASLYPLQIDKVSDPDVVKWTSACEAAGLVRVYPAQDGKRYLEIVKFGQQVRSKSKYPPPMEGESEQLKSSDINCSQMLTQSYSYSESNRDANASLVGSAEAQTDLLGEQTSSGGLQTDCPHKEIIELYHRELPTLPAVRTWTGKRPQWLQARWRERMADGKYADRQGGLDYWKRYFAYVSQSDFLCGKTTDSQFLADLEWLVNASNFAKVIEGRYHRQGGGT